jgi:hypothetical protein
MTTGDCFSPFQKQRDVSLVCYRKEHLVGLSEDIMISLTLEL